MSKTTFFLLVLLGVLAGYLGYELYTRKVPCVTPVSYNLVSLDPKFNISQSEVDSMLKDAAAVWNEALDKEVFVEGSKPELPIYFVYGQVQQAVDTLESLNSDIDAAKDEATKVANEFSARQKQGAPAEELQVLQAKYYALKDRIDADLAKSRNAVPDHEIKEGRYISDAEGQRIYIYGYQTKTDLRRALTHEFGHALGLDHVENKNSVMYPDNAGTNVDLTAEDRAELVRACAR